MSPAAARKQSPDSASKAKRNGARDAPPNPQRTRGSFPVPFIQRKPACACGGGCPRCKGHPAQGGLEIGRPRDSYEREADRMAEQVTRVSDPQRPEKPPVLQRRAARNAEPEEVPPIVHGVLRSPGQPLDPDTRAFMETRFGDDFGRVRVHTDAEAAQSARAVSALAYTVGRDVVFAEGRYDPGAEQGRKLLAHELTHTIQQSRLAPDGTAPERTAEDSASRLTTSSGALAPGHGIILQRAPAPPTEIEMPPDPVRPIVPPVPGDELAKFTKQPNYIDNNIKRVSFYTAELAIIHYHDGTSFELGLVPRWMKPPVVEVDYRTPRWEYDLRHDKKEGLSFIRQSDVQNVPRGMSSAEVQKLYGRPVDFFVQPGTGRVVPSRVNMLTAPTLCQMLLDSEKKFVEQIKGVAEWGTEVTEVIGAMGGGGSVVGTGSRVTRRAGSRQAGRIASRQAARHAVEQMTKKMDDLLKTGNPGNIHVAGVVFERVQIARQGASLAVRRWRIQRLKAPPGQGRAMHEAFEDAAVSVARANGLKTVIIDVGVIINRSWAKWLKSIGYVRNQDNVWIKTITL